ncbi:MAG: hypothetical protein CMO81_12255 [Waddliaceae bacterium]|nr:hypothetical protein [Waddliaceae bacterium]
MGLIKLRNALFVLFGLSIISTFSLVADTFDDDIEDINEISSTRQEYEEDFPGSFQDLLLPESEDTETPYDDFDDVPNYNIASEKIPAGSLLALADRAVAGNTDSDLIHYDFIIKNPLGSIAVTDEPLSPEEDNDKRYEINFNNVPITEYLKFISKISGKNFVFEESDLEFNVTIVSEVPASIQEVLSILMQVLRIHELSLLEEGDNLLIHQNKNVTQPGALVPEDSRLDQEVITRVFRLHNIGAEELAEVLQPMLSPQAVLQVIAETRTVVLSDFIGTVKKVGDLIRSLDKPNTSLEIGRYVVRSTGMSTLIELASRILEPLAEENPLIMVPQSATNSVFIVSTPYLVERTIAIMYTLDVNRRDPTIRRDIQTGILPDSVSDASNKKNETSTNNNQRTNVRPSTQTSTRRPAVREKPAPVRVVRIQENGEVTDELGRVFVANELGQLQNEIGQTVKIDPNGQLVNEKSEPVITVRSNQLTNSLGSTYKIDEQGRFVDDKSGAIYSPEGNGVFLGNDGQRYILDGQGRFILRPTTPEENTVTDSYPDFSFFEPSSEESSVDFDAESPLYDFRDQGIPGGDLDIPDAFAEDLPVGHIQNTSFFIHKLEYREGAQIEKALKAIGESLLNSDNVNQGFVSTVNSVQFVETSNAVVFTGDRASIDRVKELVQSLDTPLRQVYIEMLIMETNIDKALDFGVQWSATNFSGNTSSGGGFITPGSLLPAATATVATSPDASGFSSSAGFNLGIIGKVLTKGPDEFTSIGALVDALHADADTNIIMTPRLVTEDGKPAEFFVGFNTRFQKDSVVNAETSVVSTNFEFRDVGTRLKIRPLLGSGDMITLDIEQEISSEISGEESTDDEADIASSIGPTTRKSRTTTRVHVNDGHFIVISGMISTETLRSHSKIPCLGGLPWVGNAFGSTSNRDLKRNLMIFIRPHVITTPEEIAELTKRKHAEFYNDSTPDAKFDYTIDPGLDFLVPHNKGHLKR